MPRSETVPSAPKALEPPRTDLERHKGNMGERTVLGERAGIGEGQAQELLYARTRTDRPPGRSGDRGLQGISKKGRTRDRDGSDNNPFPMPLTKDAIETALKCTVHEPRRKRPASVISAISGMDVLKEPWTQPPALYQDTDTYSPRSLPGEIERTLSGANHDREIQLLGKPLDPRPSSSGVATRSMQRYNKKEADSKFQALETKLEMQMRETNLLLSRLQAQEILNAKFQVPPEMGIPIGDHMRANDEKWWIRKESERRLQIEESKKLSKLPKADRLGKERERLESWSQSPARGNLGEVSTTKNADNAREVPKWKTINWARVLSRKRDDAVRPFSESDFTGGHYIGPDSYYNRFQRFQRLTTANAAGRCTSCRAMMCFLFTVFCAGLMAIVVFVLLNKK